MGEHFAKDKNYKNKNKIKLYLYLYLFIYTITQSFISSTPPLPTHPPPSIPPHPPKKNHHQRLNIFDNNSKVNSPCFGATWQLGDAHCYDQKKNLKTTYSQ